MKPKTTKRKSFLVRTAIILLVALTGLAQGARATDFITEVMLIGGTENEVNSLKDTYTEQGWTVIDNDLNAGCGSGSDYIYLLYKTADADNTFDLSFITDFYISTKRGNNIDEEVSFNGRTYHLVPYRGGDHFIERKGDLNSNCGSSSDDIHLYYTTEFASGNKAISEITFDNSEDGAVGKNGATSSGYDLNAGCGSDSKYIYMHIDNSKRASWWTISKTDDGCLISGYEGAKDKVSAITIPFYIEDKKVKGFSGMDFTDFTNLNTLYFYEFTVITKMPSVKGMKYFKFVHLKNGDGEISHSHTLPNSMTEIGDAFQGSGIEVLTLTSVTSIGTAAFKDCYNLSVVTIPNSVTSIGNQAFENCFNLTSVTINSDDIVSKQYSPTSSLKDIFGNQVLEYIIGEDVKSIGEYAFSGCTSLTSFNIPNSVTSIKKFAFSDCNSLTSITIPNSVTRIEQAVFSDCSSLTSINIPSSVTTIEYGAFYNCSGLTSITFPNAVTYIGKYAFEGCDGLTSVTFPNSVTFIGYRAFNNCSGLTSVTIPSSVTTIELHAFCCCSNLISISVDENNSVFDSRNNCNAIIETSSNTLIFGCNNTTIPSSVTSIGDWAFYGCSNLTSINIPNSVTNIGASAFSGCSSLTSVTIPNSVTSIEKFTFSDCTSLTSVTIPNSVTNIGTYAFTGCSSLTSVTIPNSVTSIENNTFQFCTSLTSVTIPNSVTSIGNNAFFDCSSLTSINIPSSVTSIGDWAFSACTDLNFVTINNSKAAISSYAFNEVQAVFDFPDDFEYGGYSSLDEFISETGIKSFQLADKTSMTISDAGVATFYSFRGLDLSEVEGLKAYVAKEYDKTTQRVTMQEVTEVPAYTGLLLVGAAGTYELPYKSSEDIDAVDANLLAGTLDPITIPSTDGEKTNFVLYATADTKPSFRPLTNGFNLKANRAYLQLPTADLPGASTASNISIVFEEATGIISQPATACPSGTWYTLDGRRLNGKPTLKGLYIVDGQKIVIK